MSVRIVTYGGEVITRAGAQGKTVNWRKIAITLSDRDLVCWLGQTLLQQANFLD